jgi:hypothetical protein
MAQVVEQKEVMELTKESILVERQLLSFTVGTIAINLPVSVS